MADRPDQGFELQLDGRTVRATAGQSLLDVARDQGIELPTLCHADGLEPAGNCRACVVEIDGERALAASCCRRAAPGMRVETGSPRAAKARRMVVELLAADQPDDDRGELHDWRARLGIGEARLPRRPAAVADTSHPAIAFDPAACIHCTRCLRACRDLQVNDVIGLAGRGAATRIVFDQQAALGDSSCVGCGECVAACPTGALLPARQRPGEAERTVDSLCPYCGVGCQLTMHVRDNAIVAVTGRDGPANHGRLCVKGRFGLDYVHHPSRLTRPLIRRDGAPKGADAVVERDRIGELFREASWEEALERAASGFVRLRAEHGPDALAGFGSAKGSNEEAYLFQKLVRTGFGSNHVDHCTRLCHASSVAALLQMIGSGAVSNPVEDVARADVILVIGSNTTQNHPVAATFLKNAVRRGSRLIVLDPRRTEIARHAELFLQFRPDSDLALLNALLHAVIDMGLTDDAFIASRTRGFEELAAHVADLSPERMAPLCGIPAPMLREAARLFATAGSAMILWGMGVSQHVHGTDNARALISLALITGQIGRPGTGLHPLRGQNNVQGASDVGLIPMMLPGYRRVDDAEARARFEALWRSPIDPRPGRSVVEILDAAHDGTLRGLYVMGENPAMSDPDLHHARAGLARLEHLVVQDLFLTETAFHADVILPASALPEKGGTFTNTDRRVQMARPAIEPPGEARQDLWIVQQMARRLGLDWDYAGPRAVFEEMRQAIPEIAGIDWERLDAEGAVTYPCRAPGDPGEPVLFTDRFPTGDGRARLVPAPLGNVDELPDADYPFVLITGRLLEHWHTGAMTRRATTLDAIAPRAEISIHPGDLRRLGMADGDPLRVASRRGAVTARAKLDPAMQPGQLFLPFCFHEAAANLLTRAALDPDAKIPGFKYTAVAVTPGVAELC